MQQDVIMTVKLVLITVIRLRYQIMKYLAMALFLLSSSVSLAWDGTDSESGSSVEIGKGNLVRAGQEIEVYDHDSGEYKNVEVESVTGNGSGADVEIYDYDTGEYRTLEMD